MKLIRLVFLTFAAILSLNVAARESVPIVNYDNIPIATSRGQRLQPDQVKQAIVAAATKNSWTVAYQADGKLLATLLVRGKHTVVVEIAYDADKYSINYKDSTNMKYEIRDNQGNFYTQLQGENSTGGRQAMIHPFYNRWVQGLKDAIQAELFKL